MGFLHLRRLNEKPALLVCVTEFDPDPLLVKSESDLGPEDLAAASKTAAAELSSSSKLSADKLERGKQQPSCLTENVNSYGKKRIIRASQQKVIFIILVGEKCNNNGCLE